MVDIDNELLFRLKALSNRIRRMMERSAITENQAELTGMQYAILGFLSDCGDAVDVYQRDVEAKFHIRRSTASEMLKALENKGFIERENDAFDTRLKKITRTAAARELDVDIRLHREQLQARLTKGICEAELQQFYATLDKIVANTEG